LEQDAVGMSTVARGDCGRRLNGDRRYFGIFSYNRFWVWRVRSSGLTFGRSLGAAAIAEPVNGLRLMSRKLVKARIEGFKYNRVVPKLYNIVRRQYELEPWGAVSLWLEKIKHNAFGFWAELMLIWSIRSSPKGWMINLSNRSKSGVSIRFLFCLYFYATIR